MAYKINEYIRGFFGCFQKLNYNAKTISYENNDCFKYFLKIRDHEDRDLGVHYLVPAFLMHEINPCKNNNVPIQIDSNAISNLSETTLLREVGMKHTYNRCYHLKKLQTKAGETYYGTNGIILDSNFNILIMVVFKVINHNVANAICYINPKIFVLRIFLYVQKTFHAKHLDILT